MSTVGGRTWYKLLSEDEVLVIERCDQHQNLVKRITAALEREPEVLPWLVKRLKPLTYGEGLLLLRQLKDKYGQKGKQNA